MSDSPAHNHPVSGAGKGETAGAGEQQSAAKKTPVRVRSRVFLGLKFLASFVLIGLVVWKTGLLTREGWSKFLVMLHGVNLVYLGLSLLCGFVLTTISSWRWQILLRSKGIDISLLRLISFYFIGRFFNLFLPTSMGGDVVRVVTVASHSGEKEEALASVFVERLIGMITLLVVVSLAIVLGLRNYDLPVITASLFFVAALLFTVLWLVFDKRLLAKISDLHADRFVVGTTLLKKLTRLQDVIRDYRDKPGVLIQVFCISCLFYLTAVVNVWLSARAFVPDVSFSTMLLAVPAIMLIMNLPVSIGGLGLMEAAYTLIFPLFGYAPALALSTALLMRFKTLVHGGIGALFHLARLRNGEQK